MSDTNGFGLTRAAKMLSDDITTGLVLDGEYNILGLKSGAARYVAFGIEVNASSWCETLTGVVDRTKVNKANYFPLFDWRIVPVEGRPIEARDHISTCLTAECATLRAAKAAALKLGEQIQQRRQEEAIPRRRVAIAM